MNINPNDRQPLGGPRRKRLKVELACEICRRRKVKCDGGRPVCGNCSKRSVLLDKCIYSSDRPTSRLTVINTDAASENIARPSGLGRRTTNEQTCPPLPPAVCEHLAPTPVTPLRSGSYVDSRGSVSHEPFGGSSSSSAFTEQIKVAIAARSGRTNQPQSPTMIPMVNIPLFPSHQDNAVSVGLTVGAEYELPPRKQADYLVKAYWSQLHPIFPVLSELRFMHAYEAFFSGTLADDTDERIFVSNLNAIFALSAQIQETMDRNQRERTSSRYFQRAQALLHLPFWEAGSIDLVQCLLLMSQYLQCTNNPHQVWMMVGSAVRVAQGIGLHLPESWTDPLNEEMAALKRRVWQLCIIMDRMLSLTHGRPIMIDEGFTRTVLHAQHHVQLSPNKNDQLPHNEFVVRSLELYEISSHAVQRDLLPPRPRDLKEGLSGIVDPTPTEEKLALMIQIDGSLKRWEGSLPTPLKFEGFKHLQDDTCMRQATILHLRSLHARIILFRPMLARCCFATEPESRPCGNLTGPLIEQCASACVTAAQDMVLFVSQHQAGSVGLLPPWWYRVLYAYTAAMVLAVSALRPDLFPQSATHAAWENALMIFQAHENLSEPIRVCKVALQRMFSRIQEIPRESDFASLVQEEFFAARDNTTQGHPLFFQDAPFDLDTTPFLGLDWML